jgi:hypothetical protein
MSGVTVEVRYHDFKWTGTLFIRWRSMFVTEFTE